MYFINSGNRGSLSVMSKHASNGENGAGGKKSPEDWRNSICKGFPLRETILGKMAYLAKVSNFTIIRHKIQRDGRGVCQCAAFVWTDLKIGRAVLLFYRVLMIQTYIILKIKGHYKLLGDCKPGTNSFVRSKEFKMTKFANCCTVGLQVSALQKKSTQLFSRG